MRQVRKATTGAEQKTQGTKLQNKGNTKNTTVKPKYKSTYRKATRPKVPNSKYKGKASKFKCPY